MVSQGQEAQSQSPMFSLDVLYCEEERFEEDWGEYGLEEGIHNSDEGLKKPLFVFEHDLHWERDELESLISRERLVHLGRTDLTSDGSVMAARNEAVEWIMRVGGHYSFAALTIVLAVMYFDRFISSLRFQRETPWMTHLAAVACLSLAAKIEEPQVPLLLDLQLQVEEPKYVFEAKTVQRMELLVLSTLQWKMNLVTPLSFIEYIVRRLGWKTLLQWHFLRSCERLVLSIITDSRYVSYLPSVLATTVLLHVFKEVDPFRALDFQNELMGILRISKDKIDDCCKLMSTFNDLKHQTYTRKRKYHPVPSSPSGVIGAYFSSDSSNDSWTVASSDSSSPETSYKKSRANNEQAILAPLAPLKHVSMGVVGSPL